MNLSAPLHGSLAERARASAHAIRCRPSVGVGVDVEAVGVATKEDAGSLARFLGKRGSGRAEGSTVRARSRGIVTAMSRDGGSGVGVAFIRGSRRFGRCWGLALRWSWRYGVLRMDP